MHNSIKNIFLILILYLIQFLFTFCVDYKTNMTIISAFIRKNSLNFCYINIYIYIYNKL